jgi:hypothetical protein
MEFDLLSVIELCGICVLAFCFVGFFTLLVAARKARDELRVRGHLRRSWRKRWIPFLLWKKYDEFENPGARFLFAISRFCLMGIIIVLGAVLLLLASELFLGNIGDES